MSRDISTIMQVDIRAPKIKAQMKLYKQNHPARQIISCIQVPEYKLTSVLAQILKELTSEYNIINYSEHLEYCALFYLTF